MVLPEASDLIGEQKNVYKLEARGPILVKGTAGSGKTLVAVHRACHLYSMATGHGDGVSQAQLALDEVSKGDRIGFFTFDTSLRDEVAADFKHKNIPIQVTNIDSWCYNFLKARGLNPRRALTDYRDGRECLFKAKATAFGGSQGRSAIQSKSDEFYLNEYDWIKGQCIATVEDYIQAKRKGRGTADRLKETDRRLFWKLKLALDEELTRRGLETFRNRVLRALEELDANPLSEAEQFDHIIVDEAQDFTLARLRLIARLAKGKTPEEKSISLFADSGQCIYESGTSWKEAGLAVVGRAYEFKHNYRNTVQIARAAQSLLAQEPDQSDLVASELPRREGPQPRLVCGPENRALTELLHILQNIPASETCAIGVTSNRLRRELPEKLKDQGFETVASKENGSPLIQVRTLHKLKGPAV
ncbi:MAG: UvrD-helicase domain-containing protein [Kiritimatiellia bacterium]